MATVNINDSVQLTGTVQISDQSSLALANLKNLNFSTIPVVGDFGKSIDKFMLDQVKVGVVLAAPSILIGDVGGATVGAGVNAALSIYNPQHGTLFGDDDFAPVLEIQAGECWAGLCIHVALQEGVAAGTASGFGVSLKVGEAASLSTFVHFPYPASNLGAVIPTFAEGLAKLLESYCVPVTAQQVRAMPAGVAHVAEVSGTVSLGASYSVPLAMNPMATLNLPLNLALKIAPDVDASITGAITLAGEFAVRTYRSADTKVVIGLYKKRETTLSASLITTAGIEANLGQKDLLATVLNALVPGTSLVGMNLDEQQEQDLRAGLKECVDESLSIALNACCTASASDEAAVIYELDLASGDLTKTDAAIGAALRGDWSAVEALPNATPVRHILRNLAEHRHKLTINLLGLYNAVSIRDYLNSTTVVRDEHGQISIVDKVEAKSMSAGTTPYAAKSEKLRSVLAEDFIATITYVACTGKLSVGSFAVHQSFLEYHALAGPNDLKRQTALANVFGFALNAELDAIVKGRNSFGHNKFCLDAAYGVGDVYRLFYQDVNSRTPFTQAALDQIGRKAKIDLLDPMATNSMQRRMVLSNDAAWNSMNDTGNVVMFKTLPALARLDATAVAAISADWTDIRWWSDAMRGIAPKLTQVLMAVEQSTSANPMSDPAFVSAHKNLENALSNLTKQTHSAFGDGWPLAVMYRVAASAAGPSVEMNISVEGKSENESSGPQIARTQSSSG